MQFTSFSLTFFFTSLMVIITTACTQQTLNKESQQNIIEKSSSNKVDVPIKDILKQRGKSSDDHESETYSPFRYKKNDPLTYKSNVHSHIHEHPNHCLTPDEFNNKVCIQALSRKHRS